MYGKKVSFAAIFFAIYVLCAGFQCNKGIGCAETLYNFEIGIKATPDKDILALIDTLWLELREPTTLKDVNTARLINYDAAANLGTVLNIIELLGNKQSKEAANDFKYLVINGKEVYRTEIVRAKEYLFEKLNSNYLFKLGITPKRRGIYRISVSDAANVYLYNNKCTKANFRINFRETNQHLHYNEENFGVIVDLPSNGYCFKVE